MKTFRYTCSLCDESYPGDHEMYICDVCGGNLDVRMDFGAVRPEDVTSSSAASIWRYAPLLPVDVPGGTPGALHSVGWTPIFKPERLAQSLGLEVLLVKDEGRNPTASFKDRASAVVVARAQELGVETITTASSGNAGAALAGMAAAVGMDAVILVPKRAPEAKVAQLLVFGARVMLVDGTYDDAFDLTLEAAREFGWYCRNTGYNPFTLEGKKTAAFEIWEQLPTKYFHAKQPLNIFVSVGDGNIISGIHKGFKELHALGWIRQMPRIHGVQAEGSSAVARAFAAGTETIRPVHAETLADSICVDLPRDGVRAVRSAAQTGGKYFTVSEQEILSAIMELGQAGIFAEPAGSASYAGLKKAVNAGEIASSDPVLVLNTGNGLKDISAAVMATGAAPVIPPSLSALQEAIRKLPNRHGGE